MRKRLGTSARSLRLPSARVLAVALLGGAVACGGGQEWAAPELEAPDTAARHAMWAQLLDAAWLEEAAARVDEGGAPWNSEHLLVLDGTGGAGIYPPAPFRGGGGSPANAAKDLLLTEFPQMDPDLVRGFVAFDHDTPHRVSELETVLPVGTLPREPWGQGFTEPDYFPDLRETRPGANGVLELTLPLVSPSGEEALTCALEAHRNFFAGRCGRFVRLDGQWTLEGDPVTLWSVFVDYF